MSADAQLVNDFIQRCQQTRRRIHVAGDAMRDIYHIGQLTRICPEVPAPVFREERIIERPGAAANVTEQLVHWNCAATLHAAYPETRCVKHRYVVSDQILWRVDEDRKGQCALGYSAEIMRDQPDVLVFSDYCKGALSDHWQVRELIELCHQKEILTVVDTKRTPLSEWLGVTALKLNAAEWAAQPCDEFALSVIVTNGAKQPFLLWTDKQTSGAARPERTIVPIGNDLNVPVRSVIGAGDCFTAFLALALAHGFTLEQAGRIAHLAGGAYVQRQFNEPVLPHDLRRMVDSTGAKILESSGALRNLLSRRHDQQRIALANGVFRIPHAGHCLFLDWAKKQADVLVVAVNSDASARRFKGEGKAVLPFDERAAMLASLAAVDYVIGFDEDTPESLIKAISPDCLVKGPEFYFAKEDGQIPGQSLVAETLTAPQNRFLRHSTQLEAAIRTLPEQVTDPTL